MGLGSVITAAFILPWGRARYSPNTLTRLAAYLLALVILLMAFVRQTQLLLVVAAFAGVAWTSTANGLWLAGQRAMPAWARGRMNATVIMSSQGAMALGGVIYGTTAQTFGVRTVLVAVAVFIPVMLLTFKLLILPKGSALNLGRSLPRRRISFTFCNPGMGQCSLQSTSRWTNLEGARSTVSSACFG